ncbi:MAG TPA: LLM class flavin-dependent oxidoreductase [Actinomycetota bacterium]|nr:LLM class flavin-dependent oxidoreductase [Actinomycetota bacterium]
MRLGLALPHYDTSFAGQPAAWESLKRVATVAEQSGFDSLWVSDHLFLDWGKYGGPDTRQGSFECWSTMTVLAAVTSKVRIGSLTLCNDLRNPGLLAKMAASLDLLSGGRLDIGMGAGWYEPEYQAAGIPFDRPRTRIDRLGEAAEIVRELLSGEELTFKGRYFTFDGAVCRPRPKQQPHPPIWIGGKGDRLLRTVARVADGWNFSWLGSIDTYRERVQALVKACAGGDRDPNSIRRSVGVYMIAGHDDADAMRRYERLVERTPRGVLRPSDAGAGVSWKEFKARSFSGTIAEASDKLAELKTLGVQEVVVSVGALPFQVSDLEDVELIGTEIGPGIRDGG